MGYAGLCHCEQSTFLSGAKQSRVSASDDVIASEATQSRVATMFLYMSGIDLFIKNQYLSSEDV